MKYKPHSYVWCDLTQQNKPMSNCPKCRKFPCVNLKATDIATIAENHPLELIVKKLTKGKVSNMYFLEDSKGEIKAYHGVLPEMDDNLAGQIVAAYEVVQCFEQKLTWVAEEKVKVSKPAKETETKISVVQYRDKSLKVEEISPTIPSQEVSKIYPIKKKFVRQYIPVKVEIEKPKAPREPKKVSQK